MVLENMIVTSVGLNLLISILSPYNSWHTVVLEIINVNSVGKHLL